MSKSFSLVIVATTMVFCAASAWADAGEFRGPYLNDVTSDAVTVMWESPTATTGIVRYGVASIDENMVADTTPATHHEVRLTGLAGLAGPGTRFVYELEVGGVDYAGSFRTAVTGDAPFGFIALGDNRSSVLQHTAVVDALLAEPNEASFIMNTGDLVADGEIEDQWDEFFQIEADVLAHTPIYLTIGNHEVHDDDWSISERVFAEPTSVAPASDDEGFYHFVYGNAEIIVINDQVDTLFSGFLALFGGDQEPWLINVLDNPPAGVEHRFLFIHNGPYSSKPGRDGNFWLRTWMDTLKDAGIDVIISGHDHYAERGFSVNGIPYVIHGGGGAPLYETLGPRATADHSVMYGESRLGYVFVDVDGDRVEVALRTLDGHTIDSFVYGDPSHPEACEDASECGGPPAYGCPGGAWECHRHLCRYTCDPDFTDALFTCLSNVDCEDSIGETCSGEATCEMPSGNPFEWYCACDVAPQCVSAAGCEGLDPPIADCPGAWGCVDEVCEFYPDTLCDPDTPGADAGPTAPDPDAGDAPPDTPDAGAAGIDDSSGGCGCRASGSAPSAGAAWLLLAFIALRRRRRRD